MASLYAGLRRAETCFPNSTATVFLDRRMSWKAFGGEVRELAHALRGVGVRRGHRMAVVARNSDCMLQYMYAAACLGVVFVPLNVRYKDRIHITHTHTHTSTLGHTLFVSLSLAL
jgi:fatty-acyl-CoA synthase